MKNTQQSMTLIKSEIPYGLGLVVKVRCHLGLYHNTEAQKAEKSRQDHLDV